MSDKTGIEWTDATWNPIRGCTRVSEGCRNCYAEGVARRFSGPGLAYENLVRIGADGAAKAQWSGVIKFVESALLQPLRWKTGRRIFVNSMSDLFHPGVTDEMLDRIFAVMALCPQHTFQVLTKRPERMLAYLSERTTRESYRHEHDGSLTRQFAAHDRIFSCIVNKMFQAVPPESLNRAADYNAEHRPHQDGYLASWPLPNVWLGVSVENQAAADERVPLLLQTPAAIHFLSCEPLLGHVNLDPYLVQMHIEVAISDVQSKRLGEQGVERYLSDLRAGVAVYGPFNLDWVIVGGESGAGPGIRPMHPDWARGLRDQCVAAGVPFFFKQWGEWTEDVGQVDSRGRAPWVPLWISLDGRQWNCHNLGRIRMLREGKKAAGDLLDGVQWHQFPEVAA